MPDPYWDYDPAYDDRRDTAYLCPCCEHSEGEELCPRCQAEGINKCPCCGEYAHGVAAGVRLGCGHPLDEPLYPLCWEENKQGGPEYGCPDCQLADPDWLRKVGAL